jgi:2-polyprenyl-6-methoxyphenol hydroxylase-like FAD-dependent oxidoreductase
MTLIDMDETKPLKVLIIGAGLGGLTAAIALRRQGHSVKVSCLTP